jgi:predicted transcriptional regulator
MEAKTKRKVGRKPVAENGVRVQATVDMNIARRIQHMAVDRGVQAPALIREAIDEYLARGEAEATK